MELLDTQNRAIKIMIILVFLALTSSCCGQSWRRVEGSMKHVSIGEAGVWAVDSDDMIYYREGTYQEPNAIGTSWTHVPGDFKVIDVGTDIVVGIYKWFEVFYRKNITAENPTGSSWVKLDGNLNHVTVSPHGAIWGIGDWYSVWFRNGISLDNPVGTGWQKVNGRFTKIYAGPSGVWTVDYRDNIYYREGTYGGNITVGSGWTKVDGKLVYVASGSDVVVGLNRGHQLFRRTGISETNPTGDQWVPMDGQLFRIDEYGGTMWGVRSGWNIFTSPTN